MGFSVNYIKAFNQTYSYSGDEQPKEIATFLNNHKEFCKNADAIKVEKSTLKVCVGGIWKSLKVDVAERKLVAKILHGEESLVLEKADKVRRGVYGDIPKESSDALKAPSGALPSQIIFSKTVDSLKKQRPKMIVSTEPASAQSILLGIRYYNFFHKPHDHPDVKLHLYLTDTGKPTENFLGSVKAILDVVGKRDLVIYFPSTPGKKSLKDLIDTEQAPSKKREVINDSVNGAFIEAAANFRPAKSKISFFVSGEEELNLLKSVLKKQMVKGEKLPKFLKKHHRVEFQKQSLGSGYFLTLGKMTSSESLEDYVKRFIQLSKAKPKERITLFCFAGKYQVGSPYEKLCKFIEKCKEWPENLRVVPLSPQSEEELAALGLICHTITTADPSKSIELYILDDLVKAKKLPKVTRYQQGESILLK